MQWTLEVVVVPVSDIDRAKSFYAEQLGFHVDHDTALGPGVRLVQLTPTGSGCSVVIGHGAVPQMPPGAVQGLQLVVNDVRAARTQLEQRGVDVSPVVVIGPQGQREATDEDDLNNRGFCFFADPDGKRMGGPADHVPTVTTCPQGNRARAWQPVG
jgi:catechol 2,3-dioxygenase-like lactoylglutathione lyase family enzyme